MRRKRKSGLLGKVFGRLTVISYAGRSSWQCRCECRSIVQVRGCDLTSGRTRSCRCLQRDRMSATKTTHGMSQTDEYRIHAGMLKRCYNPNSNSFHHYGGRGIEVCDRWRFGDGILSGFECFFADMGPRPGKEFSLERKEVDDGYHPRNVRWATYKEQANNCRNNRLVNVADVIMTLSMATDHFGAVPYPTVLRRLSGGWSAEAAILTPPRGSPYVSEVVF